MKNNFSSSKKPKIGFAALLLFFCFLWGNGAMAQITYTWTGGTSSDWATPSNWSKTAGTSYPGTVATDLVIINKNDAPNAPVISVSPPTAVTRVTIANNFGTISGATLTINSGATLTVTSATSTAVVLNGGNLVNNGTLTINNSAPGSSGFEAKGITCGTPTVAPTIANPTTYNYSGSGALNINLTNAAAFANSSAIGVVGGNSFATYNMLFNGTTTINLSSAATTYAIRASSTSILVGTPLIIGGSGFTLNGNGGLIAAATNSSVTVNSGTVLTLNSTSTNATSGILISNSATTPVVFTNRGTIDILGSSGRSGVQCTTFTSGAAVPMFFTNQGIININLNCGTVGNAPLSIGNGGSTGTTSEPVALDNKGTLTLINTSVAAGTGAAIFGIGLAQAPPVKITNNGTLNLEGSSYSYGTKFSIVNNSILNTNSELRGFTDITNNVGASINFTKNAATATTRQVVFNGLQGTDTSGSIGSSYTDGTNTYVVVSQKFAGILTTLVTNVLSTAVIPASGTLTSTGGGTTPVIYTSFSASPVNGAITSATTNSGVVKTDIASNLNVISGVTTTSSSIIAPGGSAGKGIVDFAKATAALTGRTILQISGNTAAGVDFDQITNSAVAGTLSVAGTLDLTGIYTPAGPVAIDIVTVEATGTLSGAFGTVIGITTGWTVDYSTVGKVQLIYAATSATATTWLGGTSTGWIEALNWSNGVPNQNSDVTIGTGTFQPSPFINVNIKSLVIDAGATLQVNPGLNFTVKETITNNGTITVTNNANLIQVDNGAITGIGTTTVNRNSNALSRFDYTIWSSPVAGQDLLLFSPATLPTRFYNYSEVLNRYDVVASPSGTLFAAGSGYLIRMPDTAVAFPATQSFAGAFQGTPNNGTINKVITYNGATLGYNMVGNPYPSTIDAQAFITENIVNIESSLYFWRKINAATGSAYAVFNPLGATTATPSSALPNGTIQVGQGFFVKAKSASSVNFTNAMRVANNSGQFFKTKTTQKDRLWINLTNASDVYSQTLVGYTADATSGVDMYDAKYINDSPLALTSNITGEEYTIQGRPSFDATDVVALNFKTDVEGDFTIALDRFDGVFSTGQDVYLVDSKTGVETDLKAGSYNFTAAAVVDNTRFSLKFQKTLNVDAPAFNENSVSVYKNNGSLYVNSGSVAINTIEVYDVQGRLLVSQNNVKATNATISSLRAINQVLIVKIKGENNSVVTKKVMN